MVLFVVLIALMPHLGTQFNTLFHDVCHILKSTIKTLISINRPEQEPYTNEVSNPSKSTTIMAHVYLLLRITHTEVPGMARWHYAVQD